MAERITIKFKRLYDEFNDIELPSYATSGSSGMDLRAAVKENIIIKINYCIPIVLSFPHLLYVLRQ